jgi:hypothetical protein
VVVREDNGRGIVDDGWPKHFARMYQRSVKSTNGDRTQPDHAVFRVEQHRDELFAGRIGQKVVADFSSFGGAS